MNLTRGHRVDGLCTPWFRSKGLSCYFEGSKRSGEAVKMEGYVEAVQRLLTSDLLGGKETMRWSGENGISETCEPDKRVVSVTDRSTTMASFIHSCVVHCTDQILQNR